MLFRSKEIADKVAASKAIFAATVNRENMTDDERREAFTAFFAKRS